ncbi:MAG: DUF4392 domain-containing protein [Proteobacteria bacterium]|nr:DUF4392 domain-containing protein [Pseudomonadota bacterium]
MATIGPAEAEERIARLEAIIRRDPRGLPWIQSFCDAAKGGLGRAARAIAATPAPHVCIITGFYHPHGEPPCCETDGPPGAAHLAAAFRRAGFACRLVTDRPNAGAIKAAAFAAGLPRDFPFDVASVDGEGADLGEPVPAIASRWRALDPPITHVIAIERVGRSADGRPRNMRGFDISWYNAPLDDLFAGGPWARIAIGDGGNEIGMGSLPAGLIARSVTGGERFACVVPCDHLVVAAVSNWGAVALIAALALLRPELEDRLAAGLTREADRRILHDTVWKGPAVCMPEWNKAPTVQIMAVDALPWEHHAGVLAEIVGVLDRGPGRAKTADRREEPRMSGEDLSRRMARMEEIIRQDPRALPWIQVFCDWARGGLAAAARSLALHPRPHVGIITGFHLQHAEPPACDSDGPPGAAHLAFALHNAGIPCRLATDRPNQGPVEAAAFAAGLGRDFPFDIATVDERIGDRGRPVADILADWTRLHPPLSHVVAIERIGPAADGVARNMRRYPITWFNAPLERLFAGGPWTKIGIGDGGNELGTGSLPRDLVHAHLPNGREIACVVPCDHLIMAAVSNWGTIALIAALALLRPELKARLITGLTREADRRILDETIWTGPAVSMPEWDRQPAIRVLAVDGLPWDYHAGIMDQVLAALDG